MAKSATPDNSHRYAVLMVATQMILKEGEMTYASLLRELGKRLSGQFSSNIDWYEEVVKLDLEARGIIERSPANKQRYRLKPPSTAPPRRSFRSRLKASPLQQYSK